MKSTRRLLLTLLALYTVATGQGSSTGSSQLKNPLDARSAALGEATVSDAGRFSSWLLNPANLSSDGSTTLSLSHAQWFQDIRSEFIGLHLPSSIGSLGFAVSTSTLPGIEIREKPGPAIGTFDAHFVTIQTGFALRVSPDIRAGISAKYFYEKLFTNHATGIGIDAGVLYHPSLEGLQVAASITNAGSLQGFSNEPSDLPTFLRLGSTYTFELEEITFSASAAVSNSLKYSERHFHAGLEAAYSNFLWLRAGYETGYEARGLTAGFGILYKFVGVNYAFVPFSYGLGDGHLISLGVQF